MDFVSPAQVALALLLQAGPLVQRHRVWGRLWSCADAEFCRGRGCIL